jgi:ADP-ribose pyrophosphatase YjhB (NUDIX family)
VTPRDPVPPTTYCVHCGARLAAVRPRDAGHASCLACRTVEWRNPLPVAGVLVVRDGRVLLTRRAAGMERGPGRWAYPGGFVEAGESAEAAALRETREEVGLAARITGIVGHPHTLLDPHHLVIAYRGVAAGEPAAGDEVDTCRWFAPDEIPWDALAFPSTAVALRALLDDGIDAEPPAGAHASPDTLDRAGVPPLPAHCRICGGPMRAAAADEPGHARCTRCDAPAWRNPATASSLLAVRDGRVLLGLRADPNRPGFGLWAGPAGYIEPGERAEDAAVREIHEEAQVRARVTGLIHVYSNPSHVEVSYVGETGDDPRPSAEMSELRWFAADELPWDRLFDTCGASVRRLIARGLVR